MLRRDRGTRSDQKQALQRSWKTTEAGSSHARLTDEGPKSPLPSCRRKEQHDSFSFEVVPLCENARMLHSESCLLSDSDNFVLRPLPPASMLKSLVHIGAS